MESVGRLAGGVAHDFNNLLTGVFGYTSLLADGLPADRSDLRELVEGVQESAQKAAELTRQLLAFSRRQVLQPRIVSVNDVVVGIEPLLRRIIGETITLVTVPRPGIGNIRADPSQLEQVIVNLVVNARDAMPDGGTVAIETGEAEFDEAYSQEHFDVLPGHYVMLAVSDAGVGMDAETRMHLFEPFFTTKDPGQGTGLGLATTYGIVKQSGGHIWLYSEPGTGTTFKIYFPRVAEPADGVIDRALPAPARGSETVLLVEDEAAVRSVLTAVLERHGYQVLAASAPGGAIEIARDHAGPIDVLVSDVVMPGSGGRALAEQIGALRPGIRTLFISGYTEDAIVRQGVLDADVAFLPKPFSPETLARVVGEVLHGVREPVTAEGRE
jgi:CheY-like chemotaxis protein